MKVVAFVPIKLNNQRLPGKNTMPLGASGRPLCDYLFSTLRDIDSGLIHEKYVFCSDEKILPYIPSGLKFFKRDPYLDAPEIKGLDIIGNFVGNVDADIYVLCHVTAPFIKRESIENALRNVITGDHDSAFTAEFVQDYCWYDGKPVNYDLTNIIQTQFLKPVCIEKGEVFIFRKDVFTKYKRRIGLRPYIQEISELEAIDIDTRDDFEFAQMVANQLHKNQSGKSSE